MTKIEWSSLICDPKNPERISLHRVRKLSTILMAWLGISVALLATLVEVLGKVAVPANMVMIVVAACVLPITGGQVSDAVFGKLRSAKIQEGRAPGRRSSDAQEPPP